MPLVTWHPSKALCRAGCHLALLDLGSSAWGLRGSLPYMVQSVKLPSDPGIFALWCLSCHPCSSRDVF